jgi:hypothetical protein
MPIYYLLASGIASVLLLATFACARSFASRRSSAFAGWHQARDDGLTFDE